MLPAIMLAVDAQGQLAFLASRPTFAAHSMDTDWYAVDRQGQVSRWQSGEEGAVPYDALARPWDELIAELAMQAALASAPEPPEPPGARTGPRLISLERSPRSIGLPQLHDSWSGVVQFDSAELFQMFQTECAHWVERVLVGAEHAVEVRDLLTVVFEDYWSAGAVRAACVLPASISPHALGLYEYSCDFSGPYRRVRVPERRLLVADLPAPLRAQLAALQLGLDFNTTERFDPQTKVKCRLYGSY